MKLIISILALLVVGILLYRWHLRIRKTEWADTWQEIIGVLSIILASLGLFIMLVGIPTSRIGVNSNIRQFKKFDETLKTARFETTNDYEKATILKDIADWNEWLAHEKYMNELFDIWIPDEIELLNDIK